MRPKRCWTVLHVSIWAALVLTLNADGEDSECEVEIRVRQHTVYKADLGSDLKIECPVHFCNNSAPTILWDKLDNTSVPVDVSSDSHIKKDWKNSDQSNHGTSFLIFQNILRSDSGLYQCYSGLSVGHKIKISVYGNNESTTVTPTNDTISPDGKGDIWMYVYFSAGIVTFVIILMIISFALLHGCKGKSKKETQTENQYMAIPMVEQALPPIPSLHPSPRGSPCVSPSRRSTRKKAPPSQHDASPSQRNNEPLYGKVEEKRERQRKTEEEEGGSVVYAALNHQPASGVATRPRRPKEESSEYAAIRVKGQTPSGH